MSNVERLTTMTRHELPVDLILDGAKEAKLDQVLVLGLDADGKLYAACTTGDQYQIVWLCEQFKHDLLAGKFFNG